MSFNSLSALLDDQLQELHAAEEHLAKNLPALLQGVYSAELRLLIEQHSKESESHEKNLAEILIKRGISPHAGRCKVVDALLKRAREVSEARGNSVVLDVALICILQSIGASERSAYESAKTVAESLNVSDVVNVLLVHAREENAREQSLTVLSEDMTDSMQTRRAPEAAAPFKQFGGEA
jgi:ferritin-like metal-binding protein YciE